LEVLGGPEPDLGTGYSWRLPPPRASRLREYRIGFVLKDPFCPLGSDVEEVLSRAIEGIRKAGVELKEGWPEGFDPQRAFDTYLRILAAFLSSQMTEDQIRILRGGLSSPWAYYAKTWLEGHEATHRQWLGWTEARLRARALWQSYFRMVDAFLMPVNLVPAFPHDHQATVFERTVATPEGKRLYADMLRWISPATLTGCPAAVAPAGLTRDGLPVGLQIVGPFGEDATPIDIAGRLADVLGGFQTPPGFE
jgi:amidase